jgi:hypothetical protein
MKTLLNSLVGLLLFCATTANAQTDLSLKNELYAGYGVGSVPQIGISLGFALGNALGNAIVNGIIMKFGGAGVTYTEKITGTGAISLGYNYYPKQRWSVGLQGVFERVNDEVSFSNGNVAVSRVDLYTGMLRSDFRWVNKPGFKLYTGAAIGGYAAKSYEVGEPSTAETEYNLAFAITPLGLRFGKNIGVFVEAGLGWDGLLKAGVSGRF